MKRSDLGRSEELAEEGASRPDFDAVRMKYQVERDKRLRADGNLQYVDVSGDFRRYVDDPYVDHGFTRAAIVKDVEAVVIGGGFGGMIAATRLRQAGVDDIRIIEKGGDFGGTWYWNRYPGAQCDIESYIYLPFLEETGYMPTQKYVFGPEIRAHARRIGETFNLYRDALFQTEVAQLRWLEQTDRWSIITDRGDQLAARYVIMSNGPLHRPKLPAIPGIQAFRGHSFHTSRWDYDYTGGDTEGGLTKLADKRVAIIGTGATALQCVPHLASSSERLLVFQRTPSSVDERNNRPTDPDWMKSLAPGWQKRRMENFNILVNGGRQDIDLVHDGWTDTARTLAEILKQDSGAGASPEAFAEAMELVDFAKMNQIRARIDAIVKDPKTAEALKPWYRRLCKRPGFSDTYLQTFNRANVTLVDTMGRGVDRITQDGLVVDGVEYAADCIVFATGFEVGTAYTRRAGFEVYGRGDVPLTAYWNEGLKTLHGFYSHGFPNCFHMGVTQNAVTANFPHMLDEQALHIAEIIQRAKARQAHRIEPTLEAETLWVAEIREKSGMTLQFLKECTPGYYNGEGQPGRGGIMDELYGPGALEFYDRVRAWRSDGDMAGLELATEPTLSRPVEEDQQR